MDAARAAAMSDPDRNRWFSRRWTERPTRPAEPPQSPQTPEPDLDGLALLAEWRRQRALGEGGSR